MYTVTMKRKTGPKPDNRAGQLRQINFKLTEDELDRLYKLLPRNTRDRAEFILKLLTSK